jgi:hypothetical protein
MPELPQPKHVRPTRTISRSFLARRVRAIQCRRFRQAGRLVYAGSLGNGTEGTELDHCISGDFEDTPLWPGSPSRKRSRNA